MSTQRVRRVCYARTSVHAPSPPVLDCGLLSPQSCQLVITRLPTEQPGKKRLASRGPGVDWDLTPRGALCSAYIPPLIVTMHARNGRVFVVVSTYCSYQHCLRLHSSSTTRLCYGSLLIPPCGAGGELALTSRNCAALMWASFLCSAAACPHRLW